MRVVIIHEWLTFWAGSEQVLARILGLYPDADLFVLVDFLPQDQRGQVAGRKIVTSFIQRLPFAAKRFRAFLPLFPLAVEQFNLSGYDLVVSSSHCVAKGVITGPDQVHVSYCHSPMRYVWDLQHQYLARTTLGARPWSIPARMLFHRLRIWDVTSSNRVDHFLANSSYIAKRIAKCYMREAEVVHPPVDVDAFPMVVQKEDYFVTASRMVPYKRVPLIIEAFAAMPDLRLVVIGDGSEWEKSRAAAKGHPNIELLGHQPRAVLCSLMQRAAAFVFAAEEDFGIVPVEAQACGTPVIAFGRGGATETVRNGLTGSHFPEQSIGSIVAAVRAFIGRKDEFKPEACRANAERFSPQRFDQEFSRAIASAIGGRG